jgi:hypothetical protein
MPRPILGFCIVIIGLLIAILNKVLAETAIEINTRLSNWSQPSVGLARVMLVIGGLVFSLVGLLVLLGLMN